MAHYRDEYAYITYTNAVQICAVICAPVKPSVGLFSASRPSSSFMHRGTGSRKVSRWRFLPRHKQINYVEHGGDGDVVTVCGFFVSERRRKTLLLRVKCSKQTKSQKPSALHYRTTACVLCTSALINENRSEALSPPDLPVDSCVTGSTWDGMGRL